MKEINTQYRFKDPDKHAEVMSRIKYKDPNHDSFQGFVSHAIDRYLANNTEAVKQLEELIALTISTIPEVDAVFPEGPGLTIKSGEKFFQLQLSELDPERVPEGYKKDYPEEE